MRDPFSSMLASRAGKLALSLLLASPQLISRTSAFDFTPIPSPNINLEQLGRVAFAGDFDSISLYQYEGQNQEAPGPNSALLARFPNGLFATIQNTDGEVRAICNYDHDGTKKIVIGGTFTSVDSKHTPGGIALIDPETGDVENATSWTGSVNTLYCDNEGGQVYVGGSFEAPSNSSNAMIWKGDGSWDDLPFRGFRGGPVHSIVPGPNQTVVFGGHFTALNGFNLTGNGNGTAENNTQSLPIGAAEITVAQTSSGRPGFTDPKAIVCKTDMNLQGEGNTWLLADNAAGFWTATFGFGFQPTRLQLHNTDFEGRGTKVFRFTALPDTGIMNLTYTDPSTGERKFCDARCPLPEGNTTAQVFDFVNNIGMNEFRIDILDWYGNGGGLNGIQLFQTDIYAYAIEEFNSPKCGGATSGGSATATGAWRSTPSFQSNSRYLTATLQTNNYSPDDAKVVFRPDIPQSGIYSIKMYTPGCRGDDTCTTRGTVNVTGLMQSAASPSRTTVTQTNDFDKYDEIYNGRVDISQGFRPEVTLTPLAGQAGGNGVLTVVAQRVRFEIKAVQDDDDQELNGLFEYDASEQITNLNISASTIDKAGARLSPQSEAIINTLVTVDERLYVGGNFTHKDGLNNIFAIEDSGPTKLSGNGLNAQVSTIYRSGSTLYVGGNFTNTQDNSNGDLRGIAAYSNNQWQALGAGVDRTVTSIVPISNLTGDASEDVLAITGDFGTVRGFGNNPSFSADGFAIWVPSENNWLQNLNLSTVAISGSFSAFANLSSTERFYAGRISSQGLASSGAAYYQQGSLESVGFSIETQQQQQQASLRKRALTTGQNVNATGITTALFQKTGDTIDDVIQKTIFAGHFAATDKDGQNISNVVIIDNENNNATTGFGEGVDSNSTFLALGLLGEVLFAGGVVTGRINNNRVAGVVAYDLASKDFSGTQPPALQGTNVTVNAIAPRRNSQDVFVAGRFESAGALSCPALCVWNTERNQWNTPGGDLSGVVTNLIWKTDTEALVAGNFTVSGNHTKITVYNSENSEFQQFVGAEDLPGPVDALCPGDNAADQVWAAGQTSDGSTYLQKFDGNRWIAVDKNLFGSGTTIRGLQSLPLGTDHDESELISQNQDLLILGQVNITGFGVASAALYNGSALVPFLLSTTASGSSGSLSQILTQTGDFFPQPGKKLALGFIVLIALAIALALTFLLVVAGILIEWYRKKAAGYTPAPTSTSYTDRMGQVDRVPPEQLFGTLSGPRAPAI